VPEMPSVRPFAPADANMVGKPAFLPRLLRTHGRMFLRNVDTALPPLLADEISSEHGASASWRFSGRVRLGCQEAFVSVAAAMEAVADTSDLL
jgi:hypothetical protein